MLSGSEAIKLEKKMLGIEYSPDMMTE